MRLRPLGGYTIKKGVNDAPHKHVLDGLRGAFEAERQASPCFAVLPDTPASREPRQTIASGSGAQKADQGNARFAVRCPGLAFAAPPHLDETAVRRPSISLRHG